MSAAPIRLISGIATVGGWTMASRVLGFVRDILIAGFLGTGPVAEAFFVAFRLPNMFRRFFAEGAFNMAFVPLFAKRLEGDGPDEARRFAEEALSVLLTALLVLTALAQLAMPVFVYALASGLDRETFDLAVIFSRICFPYVIFISLAALFSGVLNAFGKFAAAAAAPVLLNVVFIAAMLLGEAMGWEIGHVLAWAAFAAGIGQLVLVARAAARSGMRLGLRAPKLTPGVRRLVVLGIPGALAGGVMQINLLVGTQVASYFDGAVGWLWYADRLYQLPLGVVGVAIGVVLLPELSRRVRSADAVGARHALNRAAEFGLTLTLPATVALIAVPELLTRLLFERGAFQNSDTAATALALSIYALGLPAFILQKLVQPVYFAREDTRTPLRFAAISMVVNIVIAAGGALIFGWLAAAVATTLAGWVNLVLLWRGVRGFGPAVAADDRLLARLPRIVAASLAMGAAILVCATFVSDLQGGAFLAAAIATIMLGGAVYGLAALALGAVRRDEIGRAFAGRRSGAGSQD